MYANAIGLGHQQLQHSYIEAGTSDYYMHSTEVSALIELSLQKHTNSYYAFETFSLKPASIITNKESNVDKGNKCCGNTD